MAELLRKYLPCMIQELAPFMSKHDLGSGVRWTDALAAELGDASFGIVCLTPENLREPWILFEAGALTKHAKGRACCLLLRALAPADVTGPLAQFQHRSFSRDEVHKLLADINSLLVRPLDQRSLDLIFDKWWPDLEAAVVGVLQSPEVPAATASKRDPTELLDELVLRVRSMQAAIERDPSQSSPPRIGRSVAFAIKEAFGELTPQQRAALRAFAIPPEPTRLSAQELETQFGKDSVDVLLKQGYIRREGSALIAHHLIVDALLRNPELMAE